MIIINIDSLSSIVGSILILTFAVYYLISYLIIRKERLHYVISATLFCFFVYLMSYALYSSSSDPGTVLFWTRLCYAAGAVIIYASYLLSSQIISKESPPLRTILIVLVTLLLIAIYYPSDLLFTRELNPIKTHSSVIKGPLFPALLTVIYLADLFLFVRFIRELFRSGVSMYLINPILYGLIFLFGEALFDGIFGAILSISTMKLSLGPIIITISLAIYSGRFLGMKDEELSRIKEENRKIYKNMIYDELSGLYSRQYFLEALDQRSAFIEREETEDCLLFMDVDKFKSVNDELGHSYGDRLISYVGKTLNRHSRKNDLCARYGGDEFLILLENCGLEDARRIARTIQKRLSSGLNRTLGHWEGYKGISFSIGIISSRCWTGDPADIIHHADLAMYEAKRQKKNSIVIYTEILKKSG